MKIFAKTDIGKVRSINQDQCDVVLNKADQLLAIVCDGMGGHRAGEIASRVVEDHVKTSFLAHPPFRDGKEIKEWMSEVILVADDLIKRMAQKDKELDGMGTTIAMAVIVDEIAYISHVGDSRVYLKEGKNLKLVTKDHTLVNQLIDLGIISEEMGETHSKRNVLLQAIGASNELKPSFIVEDFHNKLLLICSDGLFHEISKDQILNILSLDKPIEYRGEDLILEAINRGGKDNIAVSLVDNEGGLINV